LTLLVPGSWPCEWLSPVPQNPLGCCSLHTGACFIGSMKNKQARWTAFRRYDSAKCTLSRGWMEEYGSCGEKSSACRLEMRELMLASGVRVWIPYRLCYYHVGAYILLELLPLPPSPFIYVHSSWLASLQRSQRTRSAQAQPKRLLRRKALVQVSLSTIQPFVCTIN